MKPRMFIFSLVAAFGSGCTSMDKPGEPLHMESVVSIRHGAPAAQSYYQLGRYYQGQHRREQAEEAYLKAVAIDDRHIDSLNALGSLYAERGELERAAQMFERVVAMAPNVAYLYNNLGFACYLLGRLDEAYAAVYKALSLDETLARSWANLEQIVSASSNADLIAAVKSRRFVDLPAALKAAGDVQTAELRPLDTPQAAMPTLTAKADDSTQMPDQDIKLVDTVGSTEGGLVPSAGNGTTVMASESTAATSEDRGNVLNEEAISMIQGKLVCPLPTSPGDSAFPVARLEISNGNGVTGFARNVSAQLKKDRLPVTRVTNFGSFKLNNTVIEYQPGYEVATCALTARIGVTASMIAATKARPNSDIRIVLGKDALRSGFGGVQVRHIAADRSGAGQAHGA